MDVAWRLRVFFCAESWDSRTDWTILWYMMREIDEENMIINRPHTPISTKVSRSGGFGRRRQVFCCCCRVCVCVSAVSNDTFPSMFFVGIITFFRLIYYCLLPTEWCGGLCATFSFDECARNQIHSKSIIYSCIYVYTGLCFDHSFSLNSIFFLFFFFGTTIFDDESEMMTARILGLQILMMLWDSNSQIWFRKQKKTSSWYLYIKFDFNSNLIENIESFCC